MTGLTRAGAMMADYRSLPCRKRRALLLACAMWELDRSGQKQLLLVVGSRTRRRMRALAALQISRGRAAQLAVRSNRRTAAEAGGA